MLADARQIDQLTKKSIRRTDSDLGQRVPVDRVEEDLVMAPERRAWKTIELCSTDHLQWERR